MLKLIIGKLNCKLIPVTHPIIFINYVISGTKNAIKNIIKLSKILEPYLYAFLILIKITFYFIKSIFSISKIIGYN